MENKKSHKKSFRIYLSIVAVLLLLQVVAWSSRSLSDAYIDYILKNDIKVIHPWLLEAYEFLNLRRSSE